MCTRNSIYTPGILKNGYSSPSFPQSGTREWIKCSLLYVCKFFFLLSVVWQLGCHSRLWNTQFFYGKQLESMAKPSRLSGMVALLVIFLLLIWTGCISRSQITLCLNSSNEGRSLSCFLQKVDPSLAPPASLSDVTCHKTPSSAVQNLELHSLTTCPAAGDHCYSPQCYLLPFFLLICLNQIWWLEETWPKKYTEVWRVGPSVFQLWSNNFFNI